MTEDQISKWVITSGLAVWLIKEIWAWLKGSMAKREKLETDLLGKINEHSLLLSELKVEIRYLRETMMEFSRLRKDVDGAWQRLREIQKDS